MAKKTTVYGDAFVTKYQRGIVNNLRGRGYKADGPTYMAALSPVSGLHFWCPVCQAKHNHSFPENTDGPVHRAAHCVRTVPGRERLIEGYWLQVSETGKTKQPNEIALRGYLDWLWGLIQLEERRMAFRDDWDNMTPTRVEETSMARLKTEFFKNGDAMAIRTNATTEEEFISSASEVLGDLIDTGKYNGDWEFQLSRWLRQVVDITCKLRGYKADVEEQRVITAGDVAPAEGDRVGVFGARAEELVSAS